MTRIILLALFLWHFCLFSCNPDESNISRLLAEKKSLTCEIEFLKLQNDSFWNEITRYLDQSLPTDIPPPERKNMVNTRNATLLTMFRSFPRLDTAIQSKIRWAGEQDTKMADEIKAVITKIELAEQKLNLAFEELEKQDIKTFQTLKKEMMKLEKLPCQR